MITADNIYAHELVGLDAQITESTNKQIIGLAGTIVDETKKTFKLSTKSGIKQVQKSHSTWRFTLGKNYKDASGDDFVGAPYDRLRRKL